MQVDIEIGLDEALADPFPDDPGHFVAVDFDDRVFDFYLCHDAVPLSCLGMGRMAAL
jgi:hypothetical protein